MNILRSNPGKQYHIFLLIILLLSIILCFVFQCNLRSRREVARQTHRLEQRAAELDQEIARLTAKAEVLQFRALKVFSELRAVGLYRLLKAGLKGRGDYNEHPVNAVIVSGSTGAGQAAPLYLRRRQ